MVQNRDLAILKVGHQYVSFRNDTKAMRSG